MNVAVGRAACQENDLRLIERFDAGQALTGHELALVELLHDQLIRLVVVPGAMDGARYLGDLGADARSLAADLHRFGMVAYGQGEPATAASAFSLALRCRLQFGGFEDRDVITELRHWALATHGEGEFDDALAGLQCVQRLLSSVAQNDPESLDNRNDIAVVLLDCGDYRAALDVLRPLVTLNRRARPGRGKDPQTLTCESNLADALKMSGDYRGALALARRVWRDRVASPGLGPTHPDTLSSANNLAELLQRLGDLPGALRLQEQVLQGRRQDSRSSAIDTTTAVANLATTVYALGDWQRAADLERDVLRDRRKQSGTTHPDTLTAANNLAGTLRELGEFTEAGRLLKFAVRHRRRRLGVDHPETLMAMTNLADLLQERGELKAASRLAKLAWQLREASLTPVHPDTLTSLASFAAILHLRGRRALALRHQRRVLALRRQMSGPRHVDTLHAANDLATMLCKQGALDEARTLYEGIEPGVAKALGPSHADLVEVRLNLAEVLFELGDKNGALRRARSVARHFRSRSELDARDFQRCARLARLLFVLEARAVLEDLFEPLSALMWATLELLNLESAQQLLQGFKDFHDTWVRDCLVHRPDHLPRALAPLHGLESASWVRAALDRLAGPAVSDRPSDPRAAYATARQALAQSRLLLQWLDAELRSVESAQDLDGADIDALRNAEIQLRARRRAAAADERKKMVAWQSARTALETEAPDVFASLRGASATARDLQRCLGEGEGALFLIQLIDRQCAALLVTRSALATVALPALESLRGRFAAYEDAYRGASRGAALRAPALSTPLDAPGDIAQGATGGLTALAQAVQDAFWSPVDKLLRGVTRLHVVYAPTLRGLALQAGSPDLSCAYYPSLPGFLRTMLSGAQASAGSVPWRLEAGFDCAWHSSVPIPFAKAEALLLAATLDGVRTHEGADVLRMLTEPDRGRSIQLACHGAAYGEGDDRHAVLLLDAAGGVLLDPVDISSLPGAIDEFVCSTCVGGVVSQAVAVDAMGVVSALQHQGARCVIACLAPVPDFHMPLLTAFYWHERRAARQPADALDRAKRRLISGKWPTDLLRTVEDAYAAAMEEILNRARYAGPPTAEGTQDSDRALRLARSVAGWVLSDSQREALGVSDPMSIYDHQTFSRIWCEVESRRQQFAVAAAKHMVDSRKAWPQDHRMQLAHLCAFTQCFGGMRE